MSYILDALKKSDLERKQGEIPTLESDHSDLTSTQNQRSARQRKILFLLFSACLLVLAVGLWQWRSQVNIPQVIKKIIPEKQTTAVMETASQPPPQAAEQSVTNQVHEATQEAVPQVTAPTQVGAPQPREPLRKETATASVTIAKLTVVPSTGEILATPQPKAEQTLLPTPAEAKGVPNNNPPLLRELPVAQQKIIPAIKMAGHVYADEPARRMIMINNKIVREGDQVEDKLKLIRITWDGIILLHNNTEFQIKLQ